MQAISGAGYPGVASLDITDNVLPFIGGEEEKIESETVKILGHCDSETISDAEMKVSAQCNRVNVIDGHLAALRVKLSQPVSPAQVREALASFTSLPQELQLHSAPAKPIIVRDEVDRPQPRLDRDAGFGMSVTVGRIARDNVLDYRFFGVRSQHDSRGGGCGDSECRTAAGARLLVIWNAVVLEMWSAVTCYRFLTPRLVAANGLVDCDDKSPDTTDKSAHSKSVMPSIALICTANRCRSVMAHAIFVAEARKRSLAVEVYSAGVFDSQTSRRWLRLRRLA